MISNGRYYSGMTGYSPGGNDKYSSALKESIEQTGALCLNNLHNESYSPIMLLGSIQSGKTRAFMGLMSLCFDNGFDMTIILTKCSKALVQQTVRRMTSEFAIFRTGNSTVGDVVAQDILDIDFSGMVTMAEREDAVRKFLQHYRGKKRIVIVKKQADNVDRMNLFIEKLIEQDTYKRLLIVDDEADITSIGFEKIIGEKDITLRRISGAINTMRKQLHSAIEHVLLQVTATPYALYLQPENFSSSNVMPVKPKRTVVLPTGEGYIGGQYYFIESDDAAMPDYDKAQHLLHIVDQDEMGILNGTKKNSSKNSVITDGRTVKMKDFIKPAFIMPSLRNWIFDILVGAAVIQLNDGYEDFYVSAVMHAATTKKLHKDERTLLEEALDIIIGLLKDDIQNIDIKNYILLSYKGIKESVEAYSILKMPAFAEVKNKIAAFDQNGRLEGLVTDFEIKEVNSDNDVMTLLNGETGELKLENSITIFVGGQVLDRGITIPNLISFFYGRDPEAMQQDTVMQHCRMFGYRSEQLLSVTRFYTTYRLFSRLKEITIRDSILRSRMLQQESGEVIYLEAGGKIKACSPQKVLASKINTVLPEKRYLPIGFDISRRDAKESYKKISDILLQENAVLPDNRAIYHKGDPTDNKYVTVKAECVYELLRLAYEAIEAKSDGICNTFKEIESIFWFSLSERLIQENDNIALVVRKNRNLSKMKRNGTAYQDGPDDGNNEGALSQALRNTMPVLILTEQVNKEWGDKFWWPVYYTPADMNVGIYSEEQARTGVSENVFGLGPIPVTIDSFALVDNTGAGERYLNELATALTEARDYYKNEFFIKGIVDTIKPRTGIECSIFIDGESPLNPKEGVISDINKICKKAKILIDSSELTDEYKRSLINYFSSTSENEATDELRNAASETLEKLMTDKTRSVLYNKLKRLFNEIDELINNSRELFGYFLPKGSGKCEIRLYQDAIEEECRKLGCDSTDAFVLFSKYVIAHEMFHALHYADVMTQSGRWLYKNKDYFRQVAVQESLAEYFALCFSKAVDGSDANPFILESYIRDIRKIVDFPKDGGYSGALILESEEKGSCHGNNNEYYNKIYQDSLRDMPKAYLLLQAASV